MLFTPAVAKVLWLAACVLMLAAAVWEDVARRRIPNAVVFPGAAVALVLAALPHGAGAASAALGAAAGFAALFPLYLLGASGAGDVKLLAAAGAFAGYPDVLGVAIVTLASGGVLSIVAAVAAGRLRDVMANLHTGFLFAASRAAAGQAPRAADVPTSGIRIPYAVPVAIGMCAYLLLGQEAGWKSRF
ncbi:MAG: prepilin peptidase [Burkholderiales bacterium]|nr:prepilin peptidase [Burkholderiales bacterium]